VREECKRDRLRVKAGNRATKWIIERKILTEWWRVKKQHGEEGEKRVCQ
jgi:hypothetical protein